MAGPITHTYVARELLAHARKSSSAQGDWVNYEKALILGALGPDLGLFPGGLPLLSNLAHYHKTGSLTMALLSHAATGPEKAFAIGWLSHYFVDTLTHPLINEGVGELIHGKSGLQINYEESPHDHKRVELGIDGFLFYHLDLMPFECPTASSAQLNLQLLQTAYSSTYNFTPTIKELETSFLSTKRYSELLAQISVCHGSRFLKRGIPGWCFSTYCYPYLPGRLLSSLIKHRYKHYGLAAAVEPKTWLSEGFFTLLQDSISSTLACINVAGYSLQDLNFDTGEPTDYVKSAAAKQTLIDLSCAIEKE